MTMTIQQLEVLLLVERGLFGLCSAVACRIEGFASAEHIDLTDEMLHLTLLTLRPRWKYSQERRTTVS